MEEKNAMQKDGYWVIRTYKAGSLGEKTKFWVPGKRPDKNLTRKQRDAIRKQSQNEYSAVKRLARDLHENYSGEDIFFSLDYAEAGMKKLEKWAIKKGVDLSRLSEEERRNVIWEAADHELDLCLRRAQNRAKSRGIELKAHLTTSDLKYDRKRQMYIQVRVHHHLVINREALDCFKEAWGDLGGTDVEYLDQYGEDLTELASYIIGQVRRIPDAKKYRSTRNIVHPQPKDRIVSSDAELQVPRGGKLLFRREFSRCEQPQYIRYVLPKYTKTVPEDDGDCHGSFRASQ